MEFYRQRIKPTRSTSVYNAVERPYVLGKTAGTSTTLRLDINRPNQVRIVV
jgi:hypothetical protein